MARKTRWLVSRVRFATAAFYSRCPNAEEYRCFFPFVNHVEECPTCIEGIDQRRAVCPMGFHLGKKVLVHVYEECGEIYSTYDWDVNNEIVRLELDDTITDVRRIAQMLDIKVMYSIPPYPSVSRHDQCGQTPPSLSAKSRYSERIHMHKKWWYLVPGRSWKDGVRLIWFVTVGLLQYSVSFLFLEM